MKQLTKRITRLLTTIYLLASSIFVHASAMDLTQDEPLPNCHKNTPLHLHLHQQADTLEHEKSTNSFPDCYEQCMNDYTMQSTTTTKEESITTATPHTFDFEKNLTYRSHATRGTTATNQPQAPPSWTTPTPFLTTYIGSTKSST